MQQPMISIAEMKKVYQMGDVDVHALQGVSFTILPGEFVAIMGPSGSGKSTLMNMIGCLDSPTSGSYTLDGTSLVIDGDVAVTMMACEDASQQLEQQFLDALSQVATWERSGGTVTLRDGSGATQMTLQATS